MPPVKEITRLIQKTYDAAEKANKQGKTIRTLLLLEKARRLEEMRDTFYPSGMGWIDPGRMETFFKHIMEPRVRSRWDPNFQLRPTYFKEPIISMSIVPMSAMLPASGIYNSFIYRHPVSPRPGMRSHVIVGAIHPTGELEPDTVLDEGQHLDPYKGPYLDITEPVNDMVDEILASIPKEQKMTPGTLLRTLATRAMQ